MPSANPTPAPTPAMLLAQETLDYFAGMPGSDTTEIEQTACALARAMLQEHARAMLTCAAALGNDEAKKVLGDDAAD